MSKYVILEGRGKREEEYSDMLVSLHRLQARESSRKSELKVKNTAREKDGTPYIGNISHKEANSLVVAMGGRVLAASQFLDLLDDLKGDKILYDKLGKKLPSKARKELYDEIAGRREPWRGEHLADSFAEHSGVMFVATQYALEGRDQNVLVPQRLSRFTQEQEKQLSARAKKHDFYFGIPGNNSVAGFDAYSVRALLGCNGDPSDSGPQLGVRFALEK